MGSDSSHRFGPFRLDTRSRVLTRDDTVVPLAPRTLDLLLVFVTSGGRLLTKDELLRTVWGDVHVEEASLAFQVSTLRKALGEHGPAWIETVPKHGYRFTAAVDTDALIEKTAPHQADRGGLPPGEHNPWARRRVTWAIIGAAAVVVLTAGTLSLTRTDVATGDPPLTLSPLTSFPGLEVQPALSPDGAQVAFAWEGDPRKDFDIYIQLVGQGTPVPLTRDPRPEYSPSWSPDGRLIAFCRQADDGGEIVIVPSSGGSERVVARPSDQWVPACDPRFQALSWFPASDALAVVGDPAGQPGPAAVYVLSLGDGRARRITAPAPFTGGDALPAVSSDGRHLAFTRSLNQYWISAEIHLVPLNADRTAARAPELLLPASVHDPQTVAHEYQIAGLAWMPDRDEVLFTRRGLWIKPLTGRREARLVPTTGHRPGAFSVSRDGGRLAFSSGSWDLDIWEMPGPASQRAERQEHADGRPLIAATTLDTNPQYSPDGKRIAITSMRTGRLQIWVTDAGGANPVQVTNSKASPGTPRWSPDGRYIAYDDVESGNSDVYVIPTGGGPARRATTGHSNDQVPSWSRDGRWIYFESDRTGEFQLWKTKLASGATVQVTFEGGTAAFESPDGRWLYYGKRDQTGLWRKQVAGGQEEQVTDRGYAMSWGMYDKGVCLLNSLPREVTLECLEFEAGRLSTIARFPNDGRVRPRPSGSSFAVSPDGQSVLYSRVVREGSDLLLIEGLGR